MKKNRKLQLKRETISQLTKDDMGKVNGGIYTITTIITQPGICGPTMV